MTTTVKISELQVAAELEDANLLVVVQSGETKRAATSELLGRSLRDEKVALGDADTPGGVAAWQNPAGADIIVTEVRLLVEVVPTTPGGNNIATLGLADDATSVGTSTGVAFQLDQPVDTILLGTVNKVVPAGKYLNLSSFTDDGGSAEDLEGFAYIYWHPKA